MAGKAGHFAGDFWKRLALIDTKWDSYRTVHFRFQILKFHPSYLGSVGWNVHRTLQAILVAFWVPSWLPDIPSIFPGNFENFQAIFH